MGRPVFIHAWTACSTKQVRYSLTVSTADMGSGAVTGTPSRLPTLRSCAQVRLPSPDHPGRSRLRLVHLPAVHLATSAPHHCPARGLRPGVRGQVDTTARAGTPRCCLCRQALRGGVWGCPRGQGRLRSRSAGDPKRAGLGDPKCSRKSRGQSRSVKLGVPSRHSPNTWGRGEGPDSQ